MKVCAAAKNVQKMESDPNAATQSDAPWRAVGRLAKAFVLCASLVGMGTWGGNAMAATCTSIASGNWNSAGTWSCTAGTRPAAGDTVIIASPHTVTLNNNYSATNLTINAGGTLADGGNDLTLSGNAVINGTYDGSGNNGQLNMTGAGKTLSGTGTFIDIKRIQIDGSVTIPAGSSFELTLQSEIRVAGTLTIDGAITGAGQTAGNRILRVDSGGTLTVGATGSINAPNSVGEIRSGGAATNNGSVILQGLTTQGTGTWTNSGGATCSAPTACPAQPAVISINLASANPTAAASVAWTVTFNTSVTGVSSSNFTLVNSGLGGAPAITGVAGSGTTWTVTASTGTGSGTLGLNMVNTTGVSPALTNLPFTGQVYSVRPPVATRYYHDTTTGIAIGVDGPTNVTGGDQVITAIAPITALLNPVSTCPAASARSINHPTGLYTHSRWYLTTDYDVATTIGANPTGRARLRGQANTDSVVVSLYDYDPVSGAKTLIGSSPSITISGTTANYTYTIASAPYTVPADHRLMLEYHFNQPAAADRARVFCDAANAYIAVTETPVATLTCFIDKFNRANGAPAGNWVVANESGAFGNPAIVGNRLRLTDASTSVSTMAALQQLFSGAGNRIIVEFDHFAYGGNGADGIGVVLSDASVAPVPGAFGGSLGYAPKQASQGGDTTHTGFAGGWIGLALDEYGNFSANTEGRSGGAAPGLTIDSAAIRGSGSGYTGYPYHRGTATLAPGIDLAGATPAPGYRYRIIIDHSNGVNAKTSVQRNTGNGYSYLILPYDAKAEPGQAAVPTNWFLSFTGSTGASTNIHEVDNLRICSTQPQPVPTLDHILIQHDGNALTCSPESITLKACADASCSALYLGAVTFDLTNITGATWSPDPVTFSGGQTTVTLAKSTASAVTLGGVATSPAAANATTCWNTVASTANCAMTFSNSGFLVTVPDHVSCSSPNPTVTIEAVQQGVQANRCVPAFANLSLPVNLYTSYADPVSGTMGATASTGAVSTAAPGTLHNLSFNANGTASITLSYPDAGQLTLTANGTAPTGAAMTGSGTFVVAPASFVFSGIPAVPLTAGQPFNATVTAMRTACTMPVAPAAATPNFNQTVTITSSNPQPGIGNAAAIDTPLSGFSNGAASVNLTWNEVGTIDLNASIAAYLGSALSVSGIQAGVGRFHPAYFDTAVTPGCGTFTYAGSTAPVKAGQPFVVTVTANKAGGGITKNYAGATYAYSTTLSNAGVTAGLAGNIIAPAGFANGVGSANVTYEVATPQTAPLTLALRATDGDTPAVSSSGHAEGTAGIRSGRAKLGNAYGSELLGLRLPFRTEFWNNGWLFNSADSCTGDETVLGASNAVSVALTAPPPATCVQDSGSPGLSGAGCAVAGPAAQSFRKGATPGIGFAGDFNLWLRAPGAGATGAVTVTGNVPVWLQFDWNTAVPGLENPSSRATFGVYQGRKEFIYMRENY